MSENGDNDPNATSGKDGFTSNRARQLFGHRGGAKPWEEPVSANPAPEQAQETPEEKPAPEKPPKPPSAPYPRDAQYAPRPEPAPKAPDQTAPVEPSPQSSILGAVDDDGELTKLHPNYRLLMRVGAAIWGLVLVVIASSVEFGLRSEIDLPSGILVIPAIILAVFLVIRIPSARYNARGYQISHDRLRVVRGILWHSDTIVPFGRVQHIDVDQGPIERALGIATMTLHTAGSHNASVQLPGLGHELATEMREEIRAHIKRESM